MCELFGFAALSSLKYARYFCVLPPCKTGKFLFLCGRRFLLSMPFNGRAARGRRHTGRILKTSQQSGRGGLLSKNAFYFDCIVYSIPTTCTPAPRYPLLFFMVPPFISKAAVPFSKEVLGAYTSTAPLLVLLPPFMFWIVPLFIINFALQQTFTPPVELLHEAF